MNISIHKPKPGELEEKGILNWPLWTCEPSEFDWHYHEKETCYLLEGKVTVKTDTETVSFATGDIVSFQKGLSCVWKVEKAVNKHYKIG
ncbi:MAG: cupin domain-containing protein [Victivallales bacterium]|nr:cupin domain-containing protein [Victivallales bacterium]